MPKKKTPELDPKEQFKRFEKAAKESGVDPKQAEKAFKALKPSARSDAQRKP